MRVATALTCLLFSAGPLHAQHPRLARSDLPQGVAERIHFILEQSNTRRLQGPVTIGAGEVIPGNLVVENGAALVGGMIRGELVVIDADLAFEPGAAVGGDVTVVGGTIRGTETARLSGTVTVYGEGFYPEDRALRIAHRRNGAWHRHGYDLGYSALRLHVETNYNRVEGLPLQIGPDLSTGGPMPLQLRAAAIWRTAAGGPVATDRMGYFVNAEQWFDRGGMVRLGVDAQSTIQPIEASGLSDLEASLAAAAFHDDFRDYYERTGWSAYARVSPGYRPLSATIRYRDERHASAGIRDPWTLFRGDALWREQPLVGEGRIQSVEGSVELDERAGQDLAGRGLYARLSVRRVVDGTLAVPVLAGDGVAGTLPIASHFTTGQVDLRLYDRFGSAGTLNFRGLLRGALQDVSLPPQFQSALGGPGSIPGYEAFSADCGARNSVVGRVDGQVDELYYPYYGCDRMALFQAEYRGGLNLHLNHDDGWGGHWRPDGDDSGWVVFFDAGQGWAWRGAGQEWSGTGVLYDAGAGIVLGGIGIYGAAPLTGQDRAINLFVRLGPRF